MTSVNTADISIVLEPGFYVYPGTSNVQFTIKLSDQVQTQISLTPSGDNPITLTATNVDISSLGIVLGQPYEIMFCLETSQISSKPNRLKQIKPNQQPVNVGSAVFHPPGDVIIIDFNPLVAGQSSVCSSKTNIIISCIHGDCVVETKNGQVKIKDIKSGTLVLSGTKLDEYVPVESTYICWNKHPDFEHSCIVFENGLIIDPGHPMSSIQDYLDHGLDELKPAGYHYKYLGQGLLKKYSELEPSLRYNLKLPEGYHVYIANGTVVASVGYETNNTLDEHRYEDLI